MSVVALLTFANGANDNFKGVATLWGAGCASYRKALAWGTAFTFVGSLVAIGVATGLAAKFDGSQLVGKDIRAQASFLAAVALGSAGTVLLASRLGLPISTTHALTGGLVGAGAIAAGFGSLRWAALESGVILPLLFSPLAALVLTLAIYPLIPRWKTARRDCFCVDEAGLEVAPSSASAATAVVAPPAVRWARGEECRTGAELLRLHVGDGLHWLSAALISFARGLNDSPKIAALLLVALAANIRLDFGLVAVAMAVGGIAGASRVARTMSHRITPMQSGEAVTANLVAAALVTLASFWALPVSTTHVTSGGIFGIGLLRRGQADWRCVREILFSWVATLPLAATLAAVSYWLLR